MLKICESIDNHQSCNFFRYKTGKYSRECCTNTTAGQHHLVCKTGVRTGSSVDIIKQGIKCTQSMTSFFTNFLWNLPPVKKTPVFPMMSTREKNEQVVSSKLCFQCISNFRRLPINFLPLPLLQQ